MSLMQLAKVIVLMIFISWITEECTSREHNYGDTRHGYHPSSKFGMDIYGDIRRALYFDGPSEELHSFIAHTFELRNPNPTYMFILPNEKHKHLIMKRTDFKRPIFPNITELNIRLNRLSAKRFLNQEGSDIDPLISGKPSSTFYNNDENTILENIQTERTFIDYMQRLNEKAENLLEYIRKRQNPQYKNSNISRIPLMLRNADLEWQKVGLEGWRGEIIPYRDLSDAAISEKIPGTDLSLIKADLRNSKKIGGYNVSVPLQWNFLDDTDIKEKWDLPGKVSQGIAADMDDLNEVFSIMSNVLNSTAPPKWPIANPRSAHKNNDVYIARANDPFGYSTKWEFKSNSTKSRKKRGIGELYSMLKCGTGCDPLLLRGYGCYCGFLGAGIPADDIDRCCQAHDRCYGRANCPMYLQYFVPYLWKCYNGRPLCAVDNGEWGRCATQLCRCDLYLSACTRKYRCPRRRLICRSNKFRMLQNYLKII